MATPAVEHKPEEVGIHDTPLRPDASGRYGKFGGKYVPETLIVALTELEQAYKEALADPTFIVSETQRELVVVHAHGAPCLAGRVHRPMHSELHGSWCSGDLLVP